MESNNAIEKINVFYFLFEKRRETGRERERHQSTIYEIIFMFQVGINSSCD